MWGKGHIRHMWHIKRLGLAVALLLSAQHASAEEKEPLAVVALGVAGERSLTERAFSRGPAAAVEFSVIKDWLEIEVGGAKLFRRGHSEWEAEVVFRKPFNLSETTEFMVGLGPMWTVAKGESAKIGTTFMLDFMFWSSPEKKYGWFIEPSYSVTKGNERTLAVSIGLLFGVH
jgi:hypothetical protein